MRRLLTAEWARTWLNWVMECEEIEQGHGEEIGLGVMKVARLGSGRCSGLSGFRVVLVIVAKSAIRGG